MIYSRFIFILILWVLFSSGTKSQSISSGQYILSAQEKKEGFKVLFDGTSMEGWIDPQDQYYLRDGAIVKKPTKNGNLYSQNEYKDFVFRFEFQLTPGSNNGVGIRHKLFEGERGYDGMELQILDNDAPVYRHLKPAQYHGSLYTLFPAERKGMKAVGEWNEQEVKVKGTRIRITLNGEVILNCDMADLSKEQLEKRKVLTYEKGHIAFLGHDTEVMFRNMRIKEL